MDGIFIQVVLMKQFRNGNKSKITQKILAFSFLLIVDSMDLIKFPIGLVALFLLYLCVW